ncbi:MAG: monomethylamine:corrinoid methyltransferase [Deltaproteobacteria bacterium]|nr:monomethylamine:corrinoid methyltransferase [Deltaproteobacteria bacterium]MBW2122246.1 monomethylamine:corrinoid methyltransferase [Deltaproteobacteria bacterium]
MIGFLEVFKRSQTGPYISEMDFDLGFDSELREIIMKYGIKYDPENPIPNNDQLADDLFQAGLEFYERVGTFCVDSQRIIKFTREEILEALATAPTNSVFGEGKDAKPMPVRPPESDLPPWCFVGAVGAACTDEYLLSTLVEGYGLVPMADSITTPSLKTINGMTVVVNTPLEILACIRTVELSRSALRKSGRPGLPITNSIASAVTDASKIAGSQFGLRPSDGWVMGSMAEMKINYQRMNEIAYVLSLGGNILSETSPMLGGYCGGPEGVAVANVAYHFQAMMVQRGVLHLSFPIQFKHACNTSRDVLWAISLSNQAISRNSRFPLITIEILSAGPGTEMCFYENAAQLITDLVSGGSFEGPGVGKNAHVDHQNPWEARFSTEVAYATLGMKRDTANEIVKDLLSRYESKIPEAPVGKRFQDCFNVETLEPTAEYLDLYGKVREEMRKYDLKFRY